MRSVQPLQKLCKWGERKGGVGVNKIEPNVNHKLSCFFPFFCDKCFFYLKIIMVTSRSSYIIKANTVLESLKPFNKIAVSELIGRNVLT